MKRTPLKLVKGEIRPPELAVCDGESFSVEIVLNGAMNDAGLAAFGSVLSKDDVTAIRAYLIQRANQDKAASASR